MGPALDRLLASPSALALLRRLNSYTDAFECLSKHGFRHTPSSNQPFAASILSRRSLATLSWNLVQHQNHSTQTISTHSEASSSSSSSSSSSLTAATRHGSHLGSLVSLLTSVPLTKKIYEGKDPFQTLLYESNVSGHVATGPQRLVDQPEHMHNMELWLELLRFRKRLYGHFGVQHVWSGMMQRNIDLPINGPIADALWSIFMGAGFHDPLFFDQIYHHARHLSRTTGATRPNLYQEIVGGHIQTCPARVMYWHHRMLSDALVPPDAAASILEHVLHSRHGDLAYRAFKRIYKITGASALYDACMSSVCDSCDFAIALRWHKFFVYHNDLPSPAMQAKPIVVLLSAHASSQDKRLEHLGPAGQQYAALAAHPSADSQPSLPTRENMNILVGDAHGIRQKRIGDSFCARLFATDAFSADLVITGLRMLGLESLGSLALREIAVRAQCPSDYLNTLRSLELAGIKIADSTYSRVLKRFAEEDNKDFFEVIARSDQHPESYENAELQKKLFASFLAAGKVVQADTTLAILTMSEPDPDYFKSNLMLQTYSRSSDRHHVMQLLQQMRLDGIRVSASSLKVIFHSSLGRRQKGKKPQHGSTESADLDFVSNVFLSVIRSGQSFPSSQWREILRRYGMTNRFLTLERLCVWLAVLNFSKSAGRTAATSSFTKQQPPEPDQHVHTGLSSARSSPFLADVFTAPLLRAIIAWGFIGATPPLRYEREVRLPITHPASSPPAHTTERKLVPERWARGIALVRKLQDYGVNIMHTQIRREVKIRLWMLFGHGRSASKHNRLAQRRNELSLLHHVRHIEKVWGGNFFVLPDNYLQGATSDEARVYDLIFGPRRKAYHHRPQVYRSRHARTSPNAGQEEKRTRTTSSYSES